MPVIIPRFLDGHVRSALRQVPAVAIPGKVFAWKTFWPDVKERFKPVFFEPFGGQRSI
jgi:hypothetical protein